MKKILLIPSMLSLVACSQNKDVEVTSVTDAIDYYHNNCALSLDSTTCVKSKTMIYDYIRGLISIKSMNLIITEATTDTKYGDDGYLRCSNIQSSPYCMAIDKLLKELDPTHKISAIDIADVYNQDRSQKLKAVIVIPKAIE